MYFIFHPQLKYRRKGLRSPEPIAFHVQDSIQSTPSKQVRYFHVARTMEIAGINIVTHTANMTTEMTPQSSSHLFSIALPVLGTIVE